ncbi:NAD(P)/FAD-dependent oxidoreductase, partial [Mycolicibacterium sphagni]|nr:NAD(P)/FAD-dependent oxidoreductase [Mycolicibacterium sphagni]
HPAHQRDLLAPGTLHINETYSHLDDAYRQAAGGRVPKPLPCEIYCHSLTDPSILAPGLRESGAQTLTVFGLHTPHPLVAECDPEAARTELTEAVLESVAARCARPAVEVLLRDAHDRPCIEAKTTLDLEQALGMTAGHIFHGGLSWPFAEDDQADDPARRWGVA